MTTQPRHNTATDSVQDGVTTAPSEYITNERPCPIPCLYGDLHQRETRTPSGYITGTVCSLCEQTITRSEWHSELAKVSQDRPPRAGDRP